MCMENGAVVELDDSRREELLAMANDYNEDGFRVLVVATRSIPEGRGEKAVHHRR
jgi:P-type Mg2+ transporter